MIPKRRKRALRLHPERLDEAGRALEMLTFFVPVYVPDGENWQKSSYDDCYAIFVQGPGGHSLLVGVYFRSGQAVVDRMALMRINYTTVLSVPGPVCNK